MRGALYSRSLIVVTIIAANRLLCVEVIVRAIVTSGIPVGAQRKNFGIISSTLSYEVFLRVFSERVLHVLAHSAAHTTMIIILMSSQSRIMWR